MGYSNLLRQTENFVRKKIPFCPKEKQISFGRKQNPLRTKYQPDSEPINSIPSGTGALVAAFLGIQPPGERQAD